MSVSVQNDAAPRVWFVSPKDGAHLPAGEDVVVRAESEHGEVLSMVVDGTPAWSVRADAVQGSWAPGPGRHRLVAVAERPGAPDAVAAIEVVGVEPSAAGPGGGPHGPAGPPAPSAPGAGPPAEAPGGPSLARPVGGLGTFRPPLDGPDGAAPTAPPGAPGSGGRHGPSAGAVADGGRPGGGGGGEGSGWRARLASILNDPEKVAWTVALPLLLIAAGAGYLLLQRFIDGGQKLAWRGRGRPDDTIVEF